MLLWSRRLRPYDYVLNAVSNKIHNCTSLTLTMNFHYLFILNNERIQTNEPILHLILGNAAGTCGRQIYECYAQFADSAQNTEASDHLFHVSGSFNTDSCRHRTVAVLTNDMSRTSTGNSGNSGSSGSCCLSNTDHFKWFNANKQKCCNGEVKDSC